MYEMNLAHRVLTAACATICSLGTSMAAAAPPTPEVNVVNTPDVRVVNSDLSVALSEPASVNVDSVPASLTNQLQALIDAASTRGPSEADFVEFYRNTFSGPFGSATWSETFPTEVLISNLTLSTENDQGTFKLCSTEIVTDPFRDCTQIFSVGSGGITMPHTIVVPFLQPIRARAFFFWCQNSTERCEVSVNVSGTAMDGGSTR